MNQNRESIFSSILETATNEQSFLDIFEKELFLQNQKRSLIQKIQEQNDHYDRKIQTAKLNGQTEANKIQDRILNLKKTRDFYTQQIAILQNSSKSSKLTKHKTNSQNLRIKDLQNQLNELKKQKHEIYQRDHITFQAHMEEVRRLNSSLKQKRDYLAQRRLEISRLLTSYNILKKSKPNKFI